MVKILTLLALLTLAAFAPGARAENLAVVWIGCPATNATTSNCGNVKYDVPTATDMVRVGTSLVAFNAVAPATTILTCITPNVPRGALAVIPPAAWSAATDPCKGQAQLPASTWLTPPPANATPVAVTWVNPTQNADGSALTDLALIRIEWGTCNGKDSVTNVWNFGAAQASISVPPASQAGFAYPAGIGFVCIRAYAINSQGESSGPSGVVSKNLFGQLGKPVTLGQPILFP